MRWVFVLFCALANAAQSDPLAREFFERCTTPESLERQADILIADATCTIAGTCDPPLDRAHHISLLGERCLGRAASICEVLEDPSECVLQISKDARLLADQLLKDFPAKRLEEAIATKTGFSRRPMERLLERRGISAAECEGVQLDGHAPHGFEMQAFLTFNCAFQNLSDAYQTIYLVEQAESEVQ